MEPYVQTETYDPENGEVGVRARLVPGVREARTPTSRFHGVRIHDTPGEQQWMITADLKGSSEPPISERILFSFKACNWPDGLAHALREGLARVCGQNISALRGSRFAHFARHDTMGEPMALSSHPVLKIHVHHLEFMLHETRKELTRVHNHRAQMALAHHAEAIRMLAKDRESLRLQRQEGCHYRPSSREDPHFGGPARAWWTSARALNAGQMMTWADFKLKFSKYHVPPSLIKKMRDEFRELKQGRMSVVEYRDRFLTCQAQVDSSIQMEGKLHQANENRKRRMMNSGPSNAPRYRPSSSGGFAPKQQAPEPSIAPGFQRRKPRPEAPTTTTTPTPMCTTTATSTALRREPPTPTTTTPTAPRTGSNAIPVGTKDKSTITCYECGVVGHFSNECPKGWPSSPATPLHCSATTPCLHQQEVRPNNPHNRGGHLYHMNAGSPGSPRCGAGYVLC
ncbi:hypothetical protein QYE76_021183 [Lolium multiflorum]|uniref:CCHC-type domain-containing protein n=1 Tax=Lolium multiflorum TaxID=4521 RepID=A0AAD8VRZ6_LOLMU|nr:hypothetical protein QYE76_021183 [Lolium multiflorum]